MDGAQTQDQEAGQSEEAKARADPEIRFSCVMHDKLIDKGESPAPGPQPQIFPSGAA
ncbi:MAG: hypothetical protein WCA20_34055 [Candidatus Sulfotelmatobacter sp.]